MILTYDAFYGAISNPITAKKYANKIGHFAQIIGTKRTPSSMLCIVYHTQQKLPKARQNLAGLIHVLKTKMISK